MSEVATDQAESRNGILQSWHEYRVLFLLGLWALVLFCHFAIPRLSSRRQTAPIVDEKNPKVDEPEEQIQHENQENEKSQLRDSDHYVGVLAESKARPSIKSGPKRVSGLKQSRTKKGDDQSPMASAERIQPVIFYFSLAGGTEAAAESLSEDMSRTIGQAWLTPISHDLTSLDYDDYFITPPKANAGSENVRYFYILLIPTYNIDTELSNFLDHLTETHNDFRIDDTSLRDLAGYSVFGFGDREGWPTEEEGFCSQAKEVDKWMAKLTGRKRAYPLGMGDVKANAKQSLQEWRLGVQEVLSDLVAGNGLGDGVPGSGDPAESDEEATGSAPESDDSTGSSRGTKRKRKQPKAADLEDIGGSAPIATDFTTYGKPSKPSKTPPSAPKEMVPKSSPTYTSLTKQGYTIVGSHSGVKICRWTKSALRGRGSCYKFSFYGIQSHLCMETTPSLSCSNKCVFCWRHGTNPVGTTWRWTVDPPDLIFAGVKEGHYKKIKMMKGVPGVRAERFAEAMRIRHCALSLVGEPIFYPHINELLGMLHGERISTFLVCNAQHPDQLRALTTVTQLYVSIDASNRDALRRIDRPLHRDFWERFCACMDILREKRWKQRTVFRLTLVKGFNIDEEAEGYANLVERALPAFVEVKGVTYCGTSTGAAAGLTMQNVPFYEEVCAFVEALNAALLRRGLDYGIAAEHAHSCCILMADRSRFYKEDGWHTIIDYERFFACLESGKEFGPEDYVGPKTPEWALWGSGGFDPRDERVDRKGRKKEGTVTVGGGKVIEL